MSIPKIIHYVWVGRKPLPEPTRLLIEGWRRLNPDFAIRVWGNDDLDMSVPFVRNAFRMGYWSRVSDYVRNDAMRCYGGIYLDTDVEAVRPFAPLLDHRCFMGFQSEREIEGCWVNTAIMGAEPGHWFATAAVEHFKTQLTGLEPLDASTGPPMATQILKERGLRSYDPAGVHVGDLFIAPTRYFYPYHYDEAFTPACVTKDTIAIHHWHNNWRTPDFVDRAITALLPQRTAMRLYYRKQKTTDAIRSAIYRRL